MDNNNITTGYSLASKDEFKMEIISLLKKIGTKINSSSSKITTYNKTPSKSKIASIGILKIHEFKLNEALEWLEEMTDTEWIEYKADLHRDFKAAYLAFAPSVVK